MIYQPYCHTIRGITAGFLQIEVTRSQKIRVYNLNPNNLAGYLKVEVAATALAPKSEGRASISMAFIKTNSIFIGKKLSKNNIQLSLLSYEFLPSREW